MVIQYRAFEKTALELQREREEFKKLLQHLQARANKVPQDDLGNTWLGVVVGESDVTLTVHFADDNAKHEYRKATINNPESNGYIIMNIVS